MDVQREYTMSCKALDALEKAITAVEAAGHDAISLRLKYNAIVRTHNVLIESEKWDSMLKVREI